MNFKKLFLILLLVLFIFSIISCKKKDAQAELNAVPALVNKSDAIVFKDPQTGTVQQLKLAEWEEVLCLNPESPTTVEITDANTQEITKKQFYKIEKTETKKTGWIEKENLLFRESEPKEAIVIRDDCFLFTEPKEKKGVEKMPYGEKLQYLGYALPYNYPGWKMVKFMRIKLVEKYYWVIEDYVITDAFLGVMLEDAELYKRPNDIPENLEKKEDYKKMDLVPVLDKGDGGWIKVIKTSKVKDYYTIKEYYILAKASTPISYNEADYYISRHCKDLYYESKAIVDMVNEAYEQPDGDKAVAAITDKAKKIETLNKATDIIKVKLFDYPETTFKDEFDKLLVAMDEVKVIFEAELKNENTEETDVLPIDVE